MVYALESQSEFERLEEQSTFLKYDYRVELRDQTIPSGAKILDAGCGSGVVARYLAKSDPSATVIGCDFSASRISDAQKASFNPKNVTFRVEDLSKLSFSDNTYDFIVCRYVLQHVLPDLRISAISELYRVLKPSGQLLMIDFDGTLHNLYPQPNLVKKVLDRLRESEDCDLQIGRKLKYLLSSTGFEVLSQTIDLVLCENQVKREEIYLMKQRLENAIPFFRKYVNSDEEAIRFKNEYIQAMSRSDATLFYNKFILLSKKPATSSH